MTEAPASSPPAQSGRARWIVTGVVLAALITATIYLWRTGTLTPTTLRAWIESMGMAAPVVFIGAFAASSLVVGVPGIIFIVGGRLAFGAVLGFFVGYVGGMCAIALPFYLVRRVQRGAGGKPWRPKARLLVKIFTLIESRPFTAVLGVRLLVWFSPPVSAALAVTAVPTRTYLGACAVALVPVTLLGVVATGWFM